MASTSTQFPTRARRGDPENGYLIVQQMLEFLRDAFDAFQNKVVRGSNTVTNGNTTVNCAVSPALPSYSVVVTPLVDPGGRFWVSAKTASQFTINLSVAAPVGGVAFDWIAKGA